jgi:hypothetical protein
MDFLNKIRAVYDLFHPSSGYTLRYTPMYKENEETKNGKWPDGLVHISIRYGENQPWVDWNTKDSKDGFLMVHDARKSWNDQIQQGYIRVDV